MSNDPVSYFSVPFQHVMTGKPLEYDLYINSSVVEERERFVRISPLGGILAETDVAIFRAKYRSIYIAEDQRDAYLRTLVGTVGSPETKEKVEALKSSAIGYLENLFDKNKDLNSEALNQTIEGCREVVANMVDVLQSHNIDSLKELIGSLSFHDFYTYDHSINVSMYCILIYRAIKPDATRSEIVQAGLGGLLHDVGKIRIPTQIINKPGKLTDDEFTQIKKHPGYGFEFLCRPGVQLPKEIDASIIARVVFEHHENYDGTGYPNHLKGDKIHLLARITAVADFYDAITTKRSYHKPLGSSEALALMKCSCGKKLDPMVFEMFALHTAQYEKSRLSPVELPGDFDPCQPQQTLPLKKVSESGGDAGNKGYGRIKLVGKPEDLGSWGKRGNVQVIDDSRKPKGKLPPGKKTG